MERIESISSVESNLFFDSLSSVRIRSETRDISRKTRKKKQKLFKVAQIKTDPSGQPQSNQTIRHLIQSPGLPGTNQSPAKAYVLFFSEISKK